VIELKDIFSVFSNRRKKNRDKVKEIVIMNETRNRIVLVLKEKINEKNMNSYNSYSANFSNMLNEMLLQVRDLFLVKLGRFNLQDNVNNQNELMDVFNFILNCEGEYFLDFLEYIFITKCFNNVNGQLINSIVKDINYIFEQDKVQFQLTNYVVEWKDEQGQNIYGMSGGKIRSIIAYPQIISKDDDFTYSEMIKPTLELLKDNRFNNANKEFLEALEHYKIKNYKESITSCCSSIESTMKVLCKIRKWEYKENSTLNPLLLFIVEKGELPKWYENMLIIPATIRNKIGSSHGKGDQNIIASRNQARYQINIAAAEIIFLIEELK